MLAPRDQAAKGEQTIATSVEWGLGMTRPQLSGCGSSQELLEIGPPSP